MTHARLLAGALALGAAAATLAGCAGPTATGDTTAPTSYAAPTPAVDLAGVCPATVTIQQDWEPEAEHAAEYQLLGAGYTVDSAHKRVTGPLVIDGMNTGVMLQIRAGGSAIGFQSVTSEMYVDNTITLGAVSTDGAIAASASQPVTAVVSPLEKSPQILLWDPATHPNWHTIADIGASSAKVVVSTGSTYPALLVREGLIKPGQVDESYDGSPARFVASPDIALQGFATAEPYIYQHEVSAWGKPVKYQLLADVGYDIYPEALSVRTGALAALAPCLTKLVPILQRAQVEYITHPAATDALIVNVVKQYDDSWVYSAGVAGYAATTMKSLGIVADDPSGGVGGLDPARVQAAVTTFAPILQASGAKVKPGLTAAELATDRFVDKSITLK
jgi:hypothetical protein